jgi:hypothetical protein
MQKVDAAIAQMTLRHYATMFAFAKNAPKRKLWVDGTVTIGPVWQAGEEPK